MDFKTRVETFCRTQHANSEFENGEVCKWSYSCLRMVGIVYVCCMECLGTGLGQNARGKLNVACNMQNWPCFARKWGFCAQGGFSGQEIVFMAQRVV